MLKKIARLFTIKTRFEAALVTYAIAVGACTRGLLFVQQYPGWLGLFMGVACVGVVFVAGAKLFDATRKAEPAIAQGPWQTPARHFRSTSVRPRRRRRASDRRRSDSAAKAIRSR